MLFDVQSALAKILSDERHQGPLQSLQPLHNVAYVATVAGVAVVDGGVSASAEALARPVALTPSRLEAEPEIYPCGLSVGGNPRTWTGRVVSIEEWRRMSDWNKHGGTSKLWNGISRRWEPMNEQEKPVGET